MDLTLTTAPDDDEVLNIVSVAGLKSNLRISYTAEDAFIEECVGSHTPISMGVPDG